MLLLEVLGIATLGDWILALLSSTLASLAFSYYFIDVAGSYRLTSVDGVVTFAALGSADGPTGQPLFCPGPAPARRRAVHRREEVERLNQLGRVLLAAKQPG